MSIKVVILRVEVELHGALISTFPAPLQAIMKHAMAVAVGVPLKNVKQVN
jgi:hypothetical protein